MNYSSTEIFNEEQIIDFGGQISVDFRCNLFRKNLRNTQLLLLSGFAEGLAGFLGFFVGTLRQETVF